VTGGRAPGPGTVAFVVLAHSDPAHLRRLIEALDPAPVYLHWDQRSGSDVPAELAARFGARLRTVPPRRTAWGTWPLVAAELDAYELALRETDAGHVVLLSGADYPLLAMDALSEILGSLAGMSILRRRLLPRPDWRGRGGLDRIEYRWIRIGARNLRIPLKRPLPGALVPASSPQWKILSRAHCRLLLQASGQAATTVPFRRSLVPDETYVASVLSSPALTGRDLTDRILPAFPWYLRWGGGGAHHPLWLDADRLDDLHSAVFGSGSCRPVFARKVSVSRAPDLIDAIDRWRAA
jgi:hypothetical protein